MNDKQFLFWLAEGLVPVYGIEDEKVIGRVRAIAEASPDDQTSMPQIAERQIPDAELFGLTQEYRKINEGIEGTVTIRGIEFGYTAQWEECDYPSYTSDIPDIFGFVITQDIPFVAYSKRIKGFCEKLKAFEEEYIEFDSDIIFG
jgi:hypothetical protein